jgi:hypothetical protein
MDDSDEDDESSAFQNKTDLYFEDLGERQFQNFKKVSKNAESVLSSKPPPTPQSKSIEEKQEIIIIDDDLDAVQRQMSHLQNEMRILEQKSKDLAEKNIKIQQAKAIVIQYGFDAEIWVQAILLATKEAAERTSMMEKPAEVLTGDWAEIAQFDSFDPSNNPNASC